MIDGGIIGPDLPPEGRRPEDWREHVPVRGQDFIRRFQFLHFALCKAMDERNAALSILQGADVSIDEVTVSHEEQQRYKNYVFTDSLQPGGAIRMRQES